MLERRHRTIQIDPVQHHRVRPVSVDSPDLDGVPVALGDQR